MLSSDGQANAITNHDEDFTVERYRELLQLAREAWPIVGYDAIPFGQRFLLWRHDCDYSLNRALRLARVEEQEGVRATYFVNPHCEFYNLLERSQLDIVIELLNLGHDIGLHFDGMFHTTRSEAELESQLRREADLLESVLGKRPAAFSFHNPSAFHLSCEADRYSEMVNCYSGRFKKEVAYCSDSNGYWRFRRLHDVLKSATDTCLQVLTHPGWWQEEPMTPRQRVFHSVYGRARATIRFFDGAIEAGGRKNPAGVRSELIFLRQADRSSYELIDYLLHARQYPELLLALWRLLTRQVRRICQLAMLDEAAVSEANASDGVQLGDGVDELPIWALFEKTFGCEWSVASGHSKAETGLIRDGVMNVLEGKQVQAEPHMESLSLTLISCIQSIAAWGQMQSFACDGLADGGGSVAALSRDADLRTTESQVGPVGEMTRK